jgi:hypothetical protein
VSLHNKEDMEDYNVRYTFYMDNQGTYKELKPIMLVRIKEAKI